MTAAPGHPGLPRLVAMNSTAQVSGAERVLLRALTAAVESGWDVECLCPEGPLAEQLRATGARHTVIPELNLGPGSKPLAAMSTIGRWLRAARLLRTAARSSDVVLANTLLCLPTVRLARLGAGNHAVPAVWLAHDVVVAAGRLRLYRWCSAALSKVIGVSEAVATQLRSPDGAGGPVIEVIQNGVEFPVECAHGQIEGWAEVSAARPAVVGLNGLLTSWKGQEVLLDAVPLMCVPVHVELLGGSFPGDADYVAGLERKIEDLGISDKVTMLGFHPAPLEQMRSWTIAVSASTDPEACSLAVLEAMSIGLPVVATDHGGAPEVLSGAGPLVTPGDASALAAAITRLVVDPEVRDDCSASGLRRISSHHRVEVQIDALLQSLADTAQEAARS